MKENIMLQYMGITMLLGCSIATIFSVIAWILLPFTASEGLLATTFFISLATIGYFTIKYTPTTKQLQQMETETTEVG